MTRGFDADWQGWSWVRRGVLLLFLVFSGLGVVGTVGRGEATTQEMVWLALLAVAYAAVVWLRRPLWISLAFIGLFVAMELSMPDKYYGTGWFLAFAVCVDINSRRPWWAGAVVFVTLLATELSMGGPVGGGLAAAAYLGMLSLLGQFIRLSFAGSRAQRRNAALERRLERSEMVQAVHDTAGSRLTQVLMMGQELQRNPLYPSELRPSLQALIEVARTAVTELRGVINPTRVEPNPGRLEKEWFRSVRILRAAGFDVAEASPIDLPSLPPAVEDALEMGVREIVANICAHAGRGSRVVALATVAPDRMVLTWLNDVDPGHQIRTDGMGLRGLRTTLAGVEGEFTAGCDAGVFTQKIDIPLPPTPKAQQ